MKDREVIDLLMTGWAIICNVDEGNWETQTPEWQEAAATFRSDFHSLLNRVAQGG